MPCLNEARTVGRCVGKAVAALERMGVQGEVIVADNGSTDGSAEVAGGLGARVVRVPRRGYGCTLRAGIEAAAGLYVVLGDADGEHDLGPEQLAPFLERLRLGDDLVVGNRFRGLVRPGSMSRLRRYVGNPFLSGILNLFFRTPIRDAHCGLRAFRKCGYARLGLLSEGMEFASEMVVKASLHGLKMSEVPVVQHRGGRGRRSHLRPFRDGWRHLRLMLSLCPTWLYLIPGGLSLSAGLGVTAWHACYAPASGPQPDGVVWPGVLGVLLGYQLVWYWGLAQAYYGSNGLFAAAEQNPRLLRRLSIEAGLAVGAGLVALALGLLLRAAWIDPGVWCVGAGTSTTPPLVIWGVVAGALGAQTIFGSFFLGLIGFAHQGEDDG